MDDARDRAAMKVAMPAVPAFNRWLSKKRGTYHTNDHKRVASTTKGSIVAGNRIVLILNGHTQAIYLFECIYRMFKKPLVLHELPFQRPRTDLFDIK